MKHLIVLLTLTLLFTACEIFEPYDEIHYYDIGAEGYVYYQDEPIPNHKVTVSNYFKSKGYATIGPYDEEFTSDSTGYFCVKFIMRTRRQDAINYSIGLVNDTLYYDNKISISFTDLRNSKQNIQLGRLNLTRKHW